MGSISYTTTQVVESAEERQQHPIAGTITIKSTKEDHFQRSYLTSTVPSLQTVLLLYQPRTRYSLTPKHPIPTISSSTDLLIQIQAIGLNPIDWKAPDYNFGIPHLPYISGRDFAGVVLSDPHSLSGAKSTEREIKKGDVVLGIATDYRDVRKSAFQQYAVAHSYNICRLPHRITPGQGASLGVAFVAAAVALGVCFGADFSAVDGQRRGPDLLRMIRGLPEGSLPKDVEAECLNGIREDERPRPGEWIVVWGGSSTTSLYILQLARICGLRVILVGDVRKHGSGLVNRGADLLVDSHDPDRALEVIRGVTKDNLRFAVDTTSKETTVRLIGAFPDGGKARRHLVGLAGTPKIAPEHVACHAVPIKLFHEIAEVGESLMEWLERLLVHGNVSAPGIEIVTGGLHAVNEALDQMRRGEISGKRLVVEI
ncbi:GroES-like protein [Saccharata proteae CBS 121410]|uniref:GroES-like protein n=1 Tax=Saccharata proteae CBS 121410 TaxID=1314787 RepID=A0A9P4HQH6_9PEZI|nr:GroES-like protein [Saccharata proteae CBS 121410]